MHYPARRTILVNLDNVSTLHWNAKATPNYTMVAFSGGMAASVKVKETPDQIASVKQPNNTQERHTDSAVRVSKVNVATRTAPKT